MQKLSKLLPIALLLGFFFFGLDALIQSKPSSKNERVYKVVQQYTPYYLDKRFGGLQILSRSDPDFKEKPTNTTIFKEFERLEKEWGKKHLKVQNNTLLILDNNGSRLAELPLQSKEELLFIQNYYGVRP